MNERIQELALQATTITYEDDGWRLYGTEVETFNKQKFAELIVRECVSVAMEQYDDTLPWGGVEDVLKHFGVEQ